jgi:hypothetical protein
MLKLDPIKLLLKSIAQIMITGHYPIMNALYVVPAHPVAVPAKVARWADARAIVRRY